MKRLIIILISVVVTLLHSCQPNDDHTFPNNANGVFEALWHTLDTKYCYFEEKGINWDAVGAEYAQKVAKLESPLSVYTFFDLMAGMLDSLRDGHVNLYSDFDVSRNRAWYEGYPTNYKSSIVYGSRYLGTGYKRAGGLNYTLLDNGNVGYIRYESFSNGFSNTNMGYIFNYFKNCKGIIIDVRSNGGGSLSYSEQLASFFFEQKTKVGYIKHKTGKGHRDFSEPQPMYIDPGDSRYKWHRPVVVLVNRQSYSATNHFANAMRHAPYATLMGGRTGGGGGMPLSYELPNGWLVRFSAVPMMDAEMNQIEDGIYPDIMENMDSTAEGSGYDTIIEKAIERLKQ